MDDHDSFAETIHTLKTNQSNKRDPRSIRLASVTNAVLDINKDHDLSPAQIYASTINALDGTLRQEQPDTLTQISLLELLLRTISHVAPATLTATITIASRVLRGVTIAAVNNLSGAMETKDELSTINSLLQSICHVTTELLLHVPAGTNNNNDKVIKKLLHGTLVSLFYNVRSKVQRAAQDGIFQLITSNNNKHACVKEFLNVQLQQQFSKINQEYFLLPPNQQGNDELLPFLDFLQRCIGQFTTTQQIKIGNQIMELVLTKLLVANTTSTTTDASNFVAMTRTKTVLTKVTLIHGMLSILLSILVAETNQGYDKIAEFATKVLASLLLQTKPMLVFPTTNLHDNQVITNGKIVYGQLIVTACQVVLEKEAVAVNKETSDNNNNVGCKLLPVTIQMIIHLTATATTTTQDHSTMDGTNTPNLNVLFVEMTKLFRTTLTNALLQHASTNWNTCLEDSLTAMMNQLDTCTNESFLKAFAVLLQLYKEYHDNSNDKVSHCVQKLIQLHSTISNVNKQQAIQDAMSSFLEGVGMETFWNYISWSKDTSISGIAMDRVWILNVLKTTTITSHDIHLSFFQSQILGLARICDGLSITNPKQVHYHQGRVLDLWSLLVNICRQPIADLETTLPNFCTTLIRAMNDERYPQLVAIICVSLSILASGIRERSVALEELIDDEEGNKAKNEVQVMGTVSTKLLPALFKLVDTIHAKSFTANKGNEDNMHDDDEGELTSNKNQADLVQQVQVVTKAIAALAQLAPKPFLQTLFRKVVQRLLEATEKASNENSDDTTTERLCSLLSLSQALVASQSLEEDTIALLYRSLKPLIMAEDSKARVQKRAYKAMAAICQYYTSFVTADAQLGELCELLTSAVTTSQISARHMRLRCLAYIVDGFSNSNKAHMDTLTLLIGEVLLCLKDSNRKTREAAYQLLLSMANARNDMNAIFHLVTGGLGAETSHMRSATVMALSRLIFEYARNDTAVQMLHPSLLQTVLVLFDDSAREVIKSVVGFVRVSVAAMQPETLEPLLPDVVGGLLKYNKGKDRFRSKIKIILKKLVRLYGYEKLTPFVPEDDSRLLTHMRKVSEREARRKKNNDNIQSNNETNGFDDMLESDEEDSDDGRTLMTGVTGFTRMTARTGKTAMSMASKSKKSIASQRGGGGGDAKSTMASTKRSKSGLSTSIRLKNDADGEVYDMAGLTAKSVRFAEDDNNDNDDSSDDGGPIEFNESGKLIVREEDDDNNNNNNMNDTQDDTIMVAGKRRRISKFETAKSTMEEKRRKRNMKNGGVTPLGASYKSKKAGGDVKKKGQKYEPYAYVPLDGRNYTKKNRQLAVEQMGTVVRKQGGKGGGKRKRS